ncbi:hypothetical protein BTO01_22430 [Vibrio jasicida]|uniref:hypothetical protein n=1 Tax=Vibrio jasicida TaxID=766224 RepID=UPI000CF398F2|nr:hypothetical protein [Vibrio jasicida]PQJ55657.1 hypothetical protein BTO01_22430 [Vibrio jasicida]
MKIVEIINESLRFEIKKLIWFSLNNDSISVSKNQISLNSKSIEKFDSMKLDELLLFRKILLEMNASKSLSEISDCYNSAWSYAERIQGNYLKAMALIVITSLVLVFILYKDGVIYVVPNKSLKLFISIQDEYYFLVLNFYYYIVSLLSVMSRIVFQIGMYIPNSSFKLMRKQFFVYSLIWPFVLILIYNMTDIEKINDGIFNDSLFFAISGWGFQKFFQTMVNILNNIEISVSKSLQGITKKILK